VSAPATGPTSSPAASSSAWPWPARTVERELFAQGVDADSVQALLDRADRANRALLSVIDVLMRMGLVVGILGLGIVAVRTVTERRHVIGILRAIGYKRRDVILALLTESAVTATIGAAVGIAAGVAMGYLFYRQSDSQPGSASTWAASGASWRSSTWRSSTWRCCW
jgi:putative ABC transport system permease protein